MASMAEARELKEIRAVLRTEMEEKDASAVLFVGLDRTETFPSSEDEWVAFTQTGLKQALGEHLDEDTATRIAALARSVLTGESTPPPDPDALLADNGEKPTRQLPRLEGMSKVLVVASGSRLARVLKGALGSRVVPMAVGDISRVAAFVDEFEPGVLVVDLTEPVRGLGPGVATGLGDHALVVVWGTAQGAKRLVEQLAESGTRAVQLDRREGVAPLLDLVHGAAL